MKRLFFVLAATAMAVAMCPVAAVTIPAAAASAAATTAITLKPAVGPPTTKVTVTGTEFGAGETVTVDFDATLAATAPATSTGSFSTSFKVPAAARHARHTVTATGQASNLSATATFRVRTNWPNFRFNAANSGFNRYENALSPANVSGLTKAWSYPTGGIISPAVANGVVYIESGDGNIYALKAHTGARLWSYPTVSVIQSSPAVANGVVYVGPGDGIAKFHL